MVHIPNQELIFDVIIIKIQKNHKNNSYKNKENQQKKINLPSTAQFTLETL